MTDTESPDAPLSVRVDGGHEELCGIIRTMIRAVVFDLDGVVRHFDPEHVADIERRHDIAPGSIERFAFADPQIKQVTTGELSRSEWIGLIADHIGNCEAAQEWGDQPYHVDAAILDLADELRSLGLVTAILTNGTDTIPTEMALLGLPSRFEPIFNSASIGFIKPDERAFAYVLEHLTLPAGDVFFTDDSDRKLAGAATLGMITHHFTDVAGLREALRAEGIGLQ